MSVITIRTGLRRLDFHSNGGAGSTAKTRVIVEFASAAQLAENQAIRIQLGLRDGVERVLEGLPTLLPDAAKERTEFVYRLEGDVG